MLEAWNQWEGHVVNDQFQLNKYLGGSEQSAVFIAHDPARERPPAAIKLVATDPANAELQLARWRAVEELSHPHLIRLLDTGRCRLGERDLIFAVMEYAEENLAQILPERPLTPQETREMLAPTLDALAYLHGLGFVHGRLKPGNVLATSDQLKLASDSICPVGDSFFGPEKPSAYDPPEVSGSGARTPAADVWSLGMTLTEILTQRPPASPAETDPMLPENLPAPFDQIVRGCLRRDAQSRLTIANIAERLNPKPPQQPPRVAVDVPVPQKPPARPAYRKPAPARSAPAQARPAPAVGSLGSWMWRSAFPVAVAVVGVAVLLAGFRFLRHPTEMQPYAAPVRPEPKPPAGSPARGSRGGAEVQKPDAGHVAGQQTRSASRVDATPAMKPQPASMRTEVPTAASNPSASAPAANAGPGVVEQVLPNVPKSASNTITGTIRVVVTANVDPSGKVADAELTTPGPSKYFARLSLEAAQKWKFVPSSQAEREYAVYFEFRNSGIRAFATR